MKEQDINVDYCRVLSCNHICIGLWKHERLVENCAAICHQVSRSMLCMLVLG